MVENVENGNRNFSGSKSDFGKFLAKCENVRKWEKWLQKCSEMSTVSIWVLYALVKNFQKIPKSVKTL